MGPDNKPRRKIFSLIFVPGFTTTEIADMASGRGMGMSAVRRLVSAINGVVEVDTDVGWGTTFRIRVPSSLAITNVIVFSSGNIEFVLPASLIEEIIQLDATDAEEGTATINYREKEIYVKNLSEMFGIVSKVDKPSRLAIICNITDKKVALIVDEIIGQEETVIKPMNRFLGGLHIYSGQPYQAMEGRDLLLTP